MYGTLLSGQAVEITVIKAHRMTLPWCRLIAIVLGDWTGLDWTGLGWTGLDFDFDLDLASTLVAGFSFLVAN